MGPETQDRRTDLLWPLVVSMGTRLALGLVVWFGQVLIPPNGAQGVWQAFPRNLLLDGWVRWDAGYYLLAAERGYQWDAAQPALTPLILPLYPLLIRIGSVMLDSPALVALVVANGSFAAATVLLYRLVSERLGRDVARRAVLFLCLFPYGFVFAAGQAEPLALLLAVAGFSLIERRRLAGVSAAVALAVLSTPAGLGLWLALLVFCAQEWQRARSRRRRALALSATAPPALALGGYSLYLLLVGVPAQSIAAAAFGSTGYGLLGHASPEGIMGSVSFLATLMPGIVLALVALIALPSTVRLLGQPYAAFLFGAVAFPVLVGIDTIGRNLAIAFPLVVILAYFSRREAVENAIAVGFTTFLGALVLLYSGWYPADRAGQGISPRRGDVASALTLSDRNLSSKGTQLDVEVRNYLAVLGYDPPPRVKAGETLSLAFDLETLRPTTRRFSLDVHVADQKGRMWARGTQAPRASDWQEGRTAGDVQQVGIEIPLSPQIPSGAYDLELLVFDATTWESMPLVSTATGQRQRVFLDKTAIMRPSDTFDEGIKATNPISATLGALFDLRGYDISSSSIRAGQPVTVTLYLRGLVKPDFDYTVFVHLLDGEGKVVAQSDSFPVDGRYPTSGWSAGETVRDAHRLTIPRAAGAKQVRIIAGMYRLATMERLHVTGVSGEADHVVLGTFQVVGG